MCPCQSFDCIHTIRFWWYCIHTMKRRVIYKKSTHPLIRIRSRTSIKCGDVNNPVLYPHCLRILSTMAHVDPFPLVPATWIACSFGNVSTRSSLCRSNHIVIYPPLRVNIWQGHWSVTLLFSSMFSKSNGLSTKVDIPTQIIRINTPQDSIASCQMRAPIVSRLGVSYR